MAGNPGQLCGLLSSLTFQCVAFFLLCSSLVSCGLVCSIDNYGAKISSSDNTHAIQTAIDACLNGGTVVVPAGTWVSYPLTVTNGNGFTLQFASGAVLAAGPRSGWPVVSGSYTDFLVISGCSSCTVYGPSSGAVGTIDGRGTPWYEEFDKGVLQYHRPFLVVVKKSSNFKMLHLTIKNSPMFNVVLNTVKTAEIGYVTITDDWYNNGVTEPHNTDGIDPGSDSSNIHIHDCYIYNGDDSVAVKPGTTAGGCTRDILVENCEFHRGHGCSIGSIGSGCVKNVMFRNIKMYDQMGGCVVKAYNEGVGSVSNITWKDITMSDTSYCLFVNTHYKDGSSTPGISISELHYDNVVGTNCKYPPEFDCQVGKPCTGITLKNVNVNAAGKPMLCVHAAGSVSGTVTPTSCLPSSTSAIVDESAGGNGFSSISGLYALLALAVIIVVLLIVLIVLTLKRNKPLEVV